MEKTHNRRRRRPLHGRHLLTLGALALLGLSGYELWIRLEDFWAWSAGIQHLSQVRGTPFIQDLAIVFEGCPADDTFSEAYMIQTALGKGPMLRPLDKRMITHPRFQRFALDLAAELDIPVQESVRTGGSTNGAPIHLSNAGVPTIVVGIPVRYIHTHYGIATYSMLLQEACLRQCHMLQT